MNNKFTPGPWMYYDYEPQENFSIEVYSETTDNVFTSGWVASVHQQFSNRENGEANARLIAAAPEMYELLQYLAEDGAFVDRPVLASYIRNLLNRITQ